MKKIIHVDNSEFFRKQMLSFLEAEGCEVESFESAQDAHFAISGGLANMIIMWLTFSDIEGEKLLSRTVDGFAGPVVVVSSSIDENNIKKLIKLGARAVFNKSGSWKEGLKPHLSAL